MNIVIDLTDEHHAYWGGDLIVMKAPSGMDDCADCAAIVTTHPDSRVIHVAWKPNEIDLAHLAQGGTIWLSTWGGLPPHSLEVQAP